MAEHNCAKCTLRAKYDKAPESLIGKIWRWHIKFCPGWKRYTSSLTEKEQIEIKEKYNLK